METYAQRKGAVLREVRSVKKALNSLNAVLEKSRREASRLADRKTLITPESLETLQRRNDEIFAGTNRVQAAEAVLNEIAASFL